MTCFFLFFFKILNKLQVNALIVDHFLPGCVEKVYSILSLFILLIVVAILLTFNKLLLPFLI